MKALTEEQIAKLTVTVANDSPVLCLVCLANDGIDIDWGAGQLPENQLAKFRRCMVIPGPHWACPRCSTKLKEGRGWGKCPCCRVSRPARRTRWTYVVDCPCVETEAQRQATAEAEEVRRRYYEREDRPAMEKAQARAAAKEQAKAEAIAFAADRADADDCLEDMPNRTCTKPKNNLPNPFCHACRRFDKDRQTNQAPPKAATPRHGSLEQPKTSTPLRDPGSFETRRGFKETVPMQDAVADAFGDW